MHRRFTLLSCGLVSLLVACTTGDRDEISLQIEAQLRASDWQRIDMREVNAPDWNPVCVLGPYSGNETARKTLGFQWDAEGKSAVFSSDGFVLFVFVKNGQVVAYSEHPRKRSDFSDLSGECFRREEAIIGRNPNGKGWVSIAEKA